MASLLFVDIDVDHSDRGVLLGLRPEVWFIVAAVAGKHEGHGAEKEQIADVHRRPFYKVEAVASLRLVAGTRVHLRYSAIDAMR